MSKKFEEYKIDFLEAEGMLYDKEFLSEGDNAKLVEQYLEGDSSVKRKILDQYQYDDNGKNNTISFYKIVPSNIDDAKINQYITMKNFENIKLSAERLGTIKSIMVFWFSLTLIGILFFILMSAS